MRPLSEKIRIHFLRTAMRSPLGRAMLLSQLADAEDNGEASVFDGALAQVQDPALQKTIERHRADELRHAALFRAALAETGVDPGPVPDELKLLDRLDAKLGGLLNKAIMSDADVLNAYTALQVVEERAVVDFGLLQEAASLSDPALSRVLAEISQDERRHLKYCEAIARRYAPSEAARVALLEEFRRVEAEAYQEHTELSAKRLLDAGGFRPGLERSLWLAVQWVARRIQASKTRAARRSEAGSRPYVAHDLPSHPLSRRRAAHSHGSGL